MEPELGLSQMIDFYTRGTYILDLFFTNQSDLVNRCSPVPASATTVKSLKICTPRILKQPRRTLYMWGKANIDDINTKCNSLSEAIIEAVSTTANIDEVWSLIKDGYQLIINQEVPSIHSVPRFNQPWENQAHNPSKEALVHPHCYTKLSYLAFL